MDHVTVFLLSMDHKNKNVLSKSKWCFEGNDCVWLKENKKMPYKGSNFAKKAQWHSSHLHAALHCLQCMPSGNIWSYYHPFSVQKLELCVPLSTEIGLLIFFHVVGADHQATLLYLFLNGDFSSLLWFSPRLSSMFLYLSRIIVDIISSGKWLENLNWALESTSVNQGWVVCEYLFTNEHK